MALMIAIVLLLVYFFFVARPVSGTVPFLGKFEGLFHTGVAGITEKDTEEIKKLKLELEIRKAQLAQVSWDTARIANLIADAVAKIGAVVISLYLIQILLGLTRYHFRLADHLVVLAEMLSMCGGDLDKVKVAMEVIGVAHIDFGKAPAAPMEKIIDGIRDALSRKSSS